MMSTFLFAQKPKLIQGKIIVKDAPVQGIIVLNLVSEKETVTNSKGEFSILANIDDLLVFSRSNLDGQRKIIEEEDYDSGAIIIEMTSKINQLAEVEVINYSRINAVSLGILQRPAKTYTPAERRLKTATSLDPSVNAGTMMGGSISLDPLLNWISGRTKLLKTELVVERNELALAKLSDLYEDEYYTEKLKIPSENIRAFQYYCIGDSKFVESLNAKNKYMPNFLIGMLAIEYKSLLENEK